MYSLVKRPLHNYDELLDREKNISMLMKHNSCDKDKKLLPKQLKGVRGRQSINDPFELIP